MLFPDEIWKFILSFSPVLYQQRKLCQSILSYYDNQSILNESYYCIENRNILAKLLEKAIKYNQCVQQLRRDNCFHEAMTQYTTHDKVFKRMDPIESLLTHIWMLKFH